MTAYKIIDLKDGDKVKKEGLYNMPLSTYHTDIAWAESVSSSDLVTLAENGEEYYSRSYYNPDNQNDKAREKLHKPHFRFGTAAHSKILEPQKWIDDYIMRPKQWTTWRSDSAQHWRWVQEYQKGLTVITPEDIDRVDGMAERIHSDPNASSIFNIGMPEVSFFHEDPDTGVVMKIRPDLSPIRVDPKTKIVSVADNVISDYKTTRNNAVWACMKDMRDYGYDMKLANCGLLLCRMFAVDFADLDFVLVFQKTDKPYGITIIELDNEYMFRLAAKNLYAVRQFAKGRAIIGAEWQGYSSEIIKYKGRSAKIEEMDRLISEGAYPNIGPKMKIVKSN